LLTSDFTPALFTVEHMLCLHCLRLAIMQQHDIICNLTQSIQRISISAGLMPTEAHGNYLPEAPYLRETKTVRPN